MANAMSEAARQVRRTHEQYLLLEGSQKAEAMSATLGRISERISDACRKIEHSGNGVEQKLTEGCHSVSADFHRKVPT